MSNLISLNQIKRHYDVGGELVKALEEGLKDKKLTKAEKDRIMKEALDVAKAMIASRWKLW